MKCILKTKLTEPDDGLAVENERKRGSPPWFGARVTGSKWCHLPKGGRVGKNQRFCIGSIKFQMPLIYTSGHVK